MTNFTPEMVEKARKANSAEELLAIAKENNIEMAAEEAEIYFGQLNAKIGELSDDELDAVAGGGCKTSSGRTVVSSGCECFNGCYESIISKTSFNDAFVRSDNLTLRQSWFMFSCLNTCGSCRYLEFEGKTGVCGKS